MQAREPLNREYARAITKRDKLANQITMKVISGAKLPAKLVEDYQAQRSLILSLIEQGATAHGGIRS